MMKKIINSKTIFTKATSLLLLLAL